MSSGDQLRLVELHAKSLVTVHLKAKLTDVRKIKEHQRDQVLL